MNDEVRSFNAEQVVFSHDLCMYSMQANYIQTCNWGFRGGCNVEQLVN